MSEYRRDSEQSNQPEHQELPQSGTSKERIVQDLRNCTNVHEFRKAEDDLLSYNQELYMRPLDYYEDPKDIDEDMREAYSVSRRAAFKIALDAHSEESPFAVFMRANERFGPLSVQNQGEDNGPEGTEVMSHDEIFTRVWDEMYMLSRRASEVPEGEAQAFVDYFTGLLESSEPPDSFDFPDTLFEIMRSKKADWENSVDVDCVDVDTETVERFKNARLEQVRGRLEQRVREIDEERQELYSKMHSRHAEAEKITIECSRSYDYLFAFLGGLYGFNELEYFERVIDQLPEDVYEKVSTAWLEYGERALGELETNDLNRHMKFAFYSSGNRLRNNVQAIFDTFRERAIRTE